MVLSSYLPSFDPLAKRMTSTKLAFRESNPRVTPASHKKNRLSKPFEKVVRRIATYNWVLLADVQYFWMEGRKKRIAPYLPCQLPEEHLSIGDDLSVFFFQPFDEADGLT